MLGMHCLPLSTNQDLNASILYPQPFNVGGADERKTEDVVGISYQGLPIKVKVAQ